ncbi:hypothetical protein ACVGV8_17655, partial [Enterobacter intestinihominis]
APPGVKAGSVVRSGALTPAVSHRERGQTQKTANTVAVLGFCPSNIKINQPNQQFERSRISCFL